MISRLVAGLLLGPGTLASVVFVVAAALRAADFSFGVFTAIGGNSLAARPRLFLAAEVDRDDVRSVVRCANVLLAAAFRFAVGRVVLGDVVRRGLDIGDRGVEL